MKIDSYSLVIKLDPNDIPMHLKRLEQMEKHSTRKAFLNSVQSLIMSLNPAEHPEQRSLYLEKYRILIQVSC